MCFRKRGAAGSPKTSCTYPGAPFRRSRLWDSVEFPSVVETTLELICHGFSNATRTQVSWRIQNTDPSLPNRRLKGKRDQDTLGVQKIYAAVETSSRALPSRAAANVHVSVDNPRALFGATQRNRAIHPKRELCEKSLGFVKVRRDSRRARARSGNTKKAQLRVGVTRKSTTSALAAASAWRASASESVGKSRTSAAAARAATAKGVRSDDGATFFSSGFFLPFSPLEYNNNFSFPAFRGVLSGRR